MGNTFELDLDRIDGFRFQTDFGTPGNPTVVLDEPPPLGQGAGPNPARLLAAAVGNCLSASLLFCLGRSRVEVSGVHTRVKGEYRRNERNRLRIGRLDVTIRIDVPGDHGAELERCFGMFEDFCVVTATVRAGLDVTVTVTSPTGDALYTSAPGARGAAD